MAPVYPEQLDAAHTTNPIYRLIAESIPHLVWATDPDGAADYFNSRLLDYTGMGAGELSGLGWRGIIHPDDRGHVLLAWNAAARSGERYTSECRLRRGDGTYRWHHVSALPLRASDGSILRWFGTCTDIEDQVRGAQVLETLVRERTRALHEAQTRLQQIIDNEPECVKLLDAQGRLLEMNPAGLRMIEADGLQAMLGECVYPLIAPEHREAFRDLTERVCRGERGSLEFELVGLKGTRRFMETHAAPFREEASGETRLLGVTRDITDRKRAEEKASRYARDVSSLLDRLIGTQESERRRLADDLHDLIGQNLTALGIELSALKARLPPEARSEAAPRLDAMGALIDGTIEAIRGVMTELRPPALEEFGLMAALRWHASSFGKRTGMKTAVSASPRDIRLPKDAELALFRIVQEALTNAAKHSGGTSVEIDLRAEGGRVKLEVRDDGRGFPDPVGARLERRGGWGLPAMRERAEAHGGSVRIEFPGRGTRVVVEIPARDAA